MSTTNSPNPESVWESAIPTGSLGLDLALGTNGWPRGRIVEVFGHQGAGKTSLVLEAIAQVQKRQGKALLVDADHGITAASATRFGVDLASIQHIQTNRVEEVFDALERAAKQPFDLVVLDSAAALILRSGRFCTNEPDEKDEPLLRAFDHGLRMLLMPLAESRTVFLITNQIREKVGVMFGNPETTPWETMTLKNFASVRLELRLMGQIKDHDRTIGLDIKAKVIKNRHAAAYRLAQFPFEFATGIDRLGELLGLGLSLRVLARHGDQIRRGDQPLAAREEFVPMLRENPELVKELRDAIVAAYPNSPPPGSFVVNVPT